MHSRCDSFSISFLKIKFIREIPCGFCLIHCHLVHWNNLFRRTKGTHSLIVSFFVYVFTNTFAAHTSSTASRYHVASIENSFLLATHFRWIKTQRRHYCTADIFIRWRTKHVFSDALREFTTLLKFYCNYFKENSTKFATIKSIRRAKISKHW